MLGAREVVVFLSRPADLDDPVRHDAALALLPDEDHARLARFRFDVDRQQALASRALQRRALSSCAGVEPGAWRFIAGSHGKPAILAPASRLAFNVSNTRGLVACAVTLDRQVGLDVEPLRDDAPVEIVDSHFAPAERAALRALPAAEQPRRFVELWTQKEAYIKARGLGLELPLDRFWFTPGLGIDPELDDDAARWQCALWSPTAGHLAALCVARDAGPSLTVRERWLPA